ncbi:MAG: hypothetical protein QM796_04490 [Chthoniobacteraceae bacterium]
MALAGPAACSQHHHAQVADIHAEIRPHGADKPRAVRIEAVQRSLLADHDRVDRADLARRLADLGKVRQHRRLVRQGYINAEESRARQQLEQLLQLMIPDMQTGIARWNAHFFQSSIVHRGRTRVGDRIANHRQPHRQRLLRRGPLPVPQIFQRIDVFHRKLKTTKPPSDQEKEKLLLR